MTPGLLERREVILPNGDLREAIASTWTDAPIAMLLGVADDGIVWGRLSGGQLRTARDAAMPGGSLSRERVQWARLFSDDAELRIFATRGGLRACLVRETSPEALDADAPDMAAVAYVDWCDRKYQLLRQPRSAAPDPAEFVLLRGLGGQQHAPPGTPAPGAIAVRHYLVADPRSGLVRQAEHRLIRMVEWGNA